MNFAKTIRISKLQNKNKMVGSAFNPNGYTLDSLDKRDSDFLDNFENLSYEKKLILINNLKIIVNHCHKKGWSFPFEYNLLKRKGLLDLRKLKGGLKNGKNTKSSNRLL